MSKTFLRIGSLMALAAVALGAFGSHGLKAAVGPDQLHTFEIGVRYQFYHALGLLAVGLLLSAGRQSGRLAWAGWLFTLGILLFSGSLYLLAVRELYQFQASWLGPITPIGGTLFIIGWALFFLSTFSPKSV